MNRRILSFVLTLLFWSLMQGASAQSFTVGTPSTINVTTVAQIETSNITVSQGLLLNINSNNKKYDLDAIVASTSPTTPALSENKIQIRFNSISSGNTTNYITSAFTMSKTVTSDLVTNATETSGAVVTARYDIIVLPAGWLVPPGTYRYNLTLTYMENKNKIIARTVPLTIVVGKIVSLSFNTPSTPSMTLSSLTDFSTTGKSLANAHSFTLKSNSSWNFMVRSNSSSFSYTGSFGPSTMPASVLKASISGTEKTLSTTDQNLITGGAATASSATYTIGYRATPGYAYVPGVYTIALTYTLTAP